MIWFDIDNSPHVPLFRPILKELDKRKVNYFITAREFAQTKELLRFWGIPFELIGEHGGKNKIKKILNLFERSFQLSKTLKKRRITLAVSHGSRTQLLTASKLGVPSVLMLDYEYTESRIFNYLASYLLMPIYIPDERLKEENFKLKKVIRYNGFKEELYLRDFTPDPNFRSEIDVPDEYILVVIRPPSMVGNYHESKSEMLLVETIKHFSKYDGVYCLIVNRTAAEREFIESKIDRSENVTFLKHTVDGLQLLFAADIAISGGGTMNREAALLGTKAYSIFTGRRPYLDEYLREQRRLAFIEDIKDLEAIEIVRDRKTFQYDYKKNLQSEICDILLDIMKSHSS